MEDNSIQHISNMIEEIRSILVEIQIYGNQEKKFNSNDSFYREQLNLIESSMPREQLTSIIYNFMVSEKDDDVIVGKVTNRKISRSNYDHIAMECLIMEKLLEFGKIGLMTEIPNIKPADEKVVEVVTEEGPYHLTEMFNHDEQTKFEMINTFVKYISNPELKKGVNLDYLAGINHRLRYKYTESLLDLYKRDKEKFGKMDNNKKITEIEMLEYIINNREKLRNYSAQLILKK